MEPAKPIWTAQEAEAHSRAASDALRRVHASHELSALLSNPATLLAMRDYRSSYVEREEAKQAGKLTDVENRQFRHSRESLDRIHSGLTFAMTMTLREEISRGEFNKAGPTPADSAKLVEGVSEKFTRAPKVEKDRSR